MDSSNVRVCQLWGLPFDGLMKQNEMMQRFCYLETVKKNHCFFTDFFHLTPRLAFPSNVIKLNIYNLFLSYHWKICNF